MSYNVFICDSQGLLTEYEYNSIKNPEKVQCHSEKFELTKEGRTKTYLYYKKQENSQ